MGNSGIKQTIEIFADSSPQRATGRVKLYLAEQQQIFREAYESVLLPQPDLDVVGVSGDTDDDSLASSALALKPDVLLLGLRIVKPTTAKKLGMIRESCPDTAVVVLAAYYDLKGIKAVRESFNGTSAGYAYLLKHTINTAEQLTRVILSVAEGRVILDPEVMEKLVASADPKTTFLKELTPRELKILNWMAKGYNNNAVADVVGLSARGVERHINSIYSKMGDGLDSRDARVHAVMLYLRATGLLPAEDFPRD